MAGGGRLLRDCDPGGDLILSDTTAVEGGAEDDCGTAQAGAAAYWPATGELLRFEPHGDAGVAHHDGCGGCAQPDRNGARRLCGWATYGATCLRDSALQKPAHHDR